MLCAKWLRSQTSRGKLITDRKALRRVRAMLAAEEHERELFRKRHGLGETFNAGSTDKKDGEDSDYSDAEDVVRADGMVSFEGVEDDDVNIEELRRILQGGSNAAQRATKPRAFSRTAPSSWSRSGSRPHASTAPWPWRQRRSTGGPSGAGAPSSISPSRASTSP